MSLADDVKFVIKHVQNNEDLLYHNKILFEIFEGELLKYVLEDLRRQLRPESYEMIKHRVAPINILKRLVDKLAKIYSKDPVREIINGSAGDKSLFDFYFKHMGPNEEFGHSNEFFNIFKNTFVEPYVFNGKPLMRSLPSHQFIVMSNDEIDPLRPTHLVKIMGDCVKGNDKQGFRIVEKLYVYTDDEFLIIDSEGEILEQEMAAKNNPNGINPFGTIPGVYINRSKNKLIPLRDTDTLQMTKLFPILLSDINFATMFQAFSIIYGIDLDEENLAMSPNAFWRFKTDRKGGGDVKPEVGVIKPEVDTDKVIDLIKFQLTFWLESRSIRPGNVGQMSADNLASGVSKIIDEMDTTEERQKQIPIYKKSEKEFWHKITNNIHPEWARQGLVDIKSSFSPNVEVEVKFQEQRPNVSRQNVIDEQKAEIEAGFTTRKRAIQKLNPEMQEKEVLELMAEIESERTLTIEGENGGSHIHGLSGGGVTGPAIDSSDGTHYHKLPDGKNSGNSKEGPNHTHTTDQGETGPPKEVNEQSEDSEES